MSNVKQVRAALKVCGYDYPYAIYNDKRSQFRRIKISGLHMSDTGEMKFRSALKKIFGERYKAAQHSISSCGRGFSLHPNSMCVYLKD